MTQSTSDSVMVVTSSRGVEETAVMDQYNGDWIRSARAEREGNTEEVERRKKNNLALRITRDED